MSRRPNLPNLNHPRPAHVSYILSPPMLALKERIDAYLAKRRARKFLKGGCVRDVRTFGFFKTKQGKEGPYMTSARTSAADEDSSSGAVDAGTQTGSQQEHHEEQEEEGVAVQEFAPRVPEIDARVEGHLREMLEGSLGHLNRPAE